MLLGVDYIIGSGSRSASTSANFQLTSINFGCNTEFKLSDPSLVVVAEDGISTRVG